MSIPQSRATRFVKTILLAFALTFPFTGADANGEERQKADLRIRVGEKAPDFALTSGDGKLIKFSDYAGRNILIDFYRGHW
jgi:cytochrome oxidase Cu insertion factor (SCO1/SenC/PrrC family)